MISSSNFFKKTLFHSEQKSENKYLLPRIIHNPISPWQHQEDLTIDLFINKKRQTIDKQPPKTQTSKKKNQIQSNLLNATIEQKTVTNQIINPSLATIKRVPISVKSKVQDKKRKNEMSYDSMSIREYLSKQRLEILRLREVNRETIQSGENVRDFLVNRNFRKMRPIQEQSRTLDLRRQLLQPLQVFERKSVLAINPSLKQRKLQFYMVSAGKSNPLYEHRYSLD